MFVFVDNVYWTLSRLTPHRFETGVDQHVIKTSTELYLTRGHRVECGVVTTRLLTYQLHFGQQAPVGTRSADASVHLRNPVSEISRSEMEFPEI